jgi:hypothetical protein
MQTIRVCERSGKDGVISLLIPAGRPETEFEVVVVLEPRNGAPTSADNGWPPGFLDRTFGSIDDETFERPPQGELPVPPVFD